MQLVSVKDDVSVGRQHFINHSGILSGCSCIEKKERWGGEKKERKKGLSWVVQHNEQGKNVSGDLMLLFVWMGYLRWKLH